MVAEPLIGATAAITMSVVVLLRRRAVRRVGVPRSACSSGGGAAAATAAGVLMNTRWRPMGLALGAVHAAAAGRRKAAEAQALIDASFVLADRGDGTSPAGG